MEQTLRYISQPAIENIKSNLNTFWDGIKSNNLSSGAAFSFLEENPFLDSQHSFDFSFADGNEQFKKPSDSDCINSIKLYETLKDLPRNVVLSEQFLSGFLFTYGYQYFEWRWVPAYKDEASRALSHLFFLNDTRRSLAINVVGHLFLRAARLVEPELGKEHQYDLLKKAYNYPFVFRGEYHNYADNPKVHKALIKAALSIIDQGNKMGTRDFERLLTHLSMIGGISLSESLSENEIEDLLTEYYLGLNETK